MDRVPAASSFNSKSWDVMKQGYWILEAMEDTCREVPTGIMSTLKVPSDYPQQTLQDLYKSVYETFNGEEYHKNEENRKLLSPVVNKAEWILN